MQGSALLDSVLSIFPYPLEYYGIRLKEEGLNGVEPFAVGMLGAGHFLWRLLEWISVSCCGGGSRIEWSQLLADAALALTGSFLTCFILEVKSIID